MKNAALTLALLAGIGTGVVAVARAQGEKEDAKDSQQRMEYVRVPLYSVFHPDPKTEAKLERGLYIGGPRSNDQTFRLPVEIPVGATILEVGIVGQTSNQMTVRLERADWTPVYAFGETSPRDNGQWNVMSVVDHSTFRRVGKPTPEDEKYQVAKRDHEEQEFVVVVSLARNPGLTDAQKGAAVGAQADKVTALWLKIVH
jgi:hypothetical protein